MKLDDLTDEQKIRLIRYGPSQPNTVFGIPLKEGAFALTLPEKAVLDMALSVVGYPNEHADKVFHAINALRIALLEGGYE